MCLTINSPTLVVACFYLCREAKVYLRFVTSKGDTVTHSDLSLKKYTPGNSVTIRYLEKDPGFCEIVE
jgi:hypothetical protein